MTQQVTSSEEAFARVFYDIEESALPIYHDMALATIAFAGGKKRPVRGTSHIWLCR